MTQMAQLLDTGRTDRLLLHSMRIRTTDQAKRPTRNDVAREANVSGWTVSHVLNDDHSVSISEETRIRVWEAARQLGYRPNNNARALATGRTSTVGFWMCFLYSQYRAHVLHRMQNVMKGSDFELVIRDVEDELSRRSDQPNAFKIPVDGIIALDTPTAGKRLARADNGMTAPFVSVGAFWADDGDYVAVDLYAGSVDAVRHLVETGRRRIAYVVPQTDDDPNESRHLAYRTVLAEAGLETSIIRTDGVTLSGSYRAVTDFLGSNRDIDAIFCHNDDMAFGAHRAITDLGFTIGKQVALVGCDGIEETEYLSPPLSTIVQPVDEMCELAWEFLQNRINDPSIPLQQRTLKPQLVVRASSQR